MNKKLLLKVGMWVDDVDIEDLSYRVVVVSPKVDYNGEYSYFVEVFEGESDICYDLIYDHYVENHTEINYDWTLNEEQVQQIINTEPIKIKKSGVFDNLNIANKNGNIIKAKSILESRFCIKNEHENE